ncbi:MAG: hypothetical protein M1818_006404 [Claussenomyces sp. TS43310]|nr:MAG: hypothetical protein M1818_006404 [Claussenomyces sp. TS43310]
MAAPRNPSELGQSDESLDKPSNGPEIEDVDTIDEEEDNGAGGSNFERGPDFDLEKGGEIERTDSPEGGDDELRREEAAEQKEHELDPNVIVFDGPDDPGNPQNWSTLRRGCITVMLGLMTLCVTFASSVFSTATVATAELFDVSEEVMILGTSLFVIGFAVGPLIWGPMSEVFGRKIPLFSGYAIFVIFNIPVAVAQNVETIMLCRFFGGVFASTPLAVVGGALADMWDPVDRGVALATFACSTFIGPTLGPILGGFITQSHLGWRWTAWLTMIMAGTCGTIGLFVVPETNAQTILQTRAKEIRFRTKNWAVRAPIDEKPLDMRSIVNNYLTKPFRMLIQEPILLLITLYMCLVYGMLYLFFESYPISFQQERGWNAGVGALPFLSLLVGVIFAGIFVTWLTKTRFARKLKKHGRVIPEERLPPMILGAIMLPIGLFWFAWTSSPHISPWPQIIAGVPIACGIFMIFLQGLVYIVDVYLMHANSAIAGNTMVRSLAGGGFPMFATAMYHNLGVPWATSLLGFLCVALMPVPVLFYVYGAKLRKLSKFSPY